jgi:hypothetical protein
MTEKIYKIKIVNINDMPHQIRNNVINKVATQPKSFRDEFIGFAKITFVSASPIRIKSIEPIKGNPETFFNSIKQGVTIPSF